MLNTYIRCKIGESPPPPFHLKLFETVIVDMKLELNRVETRNNNTRHKHLLSEQGNLRLFESKPSDWSGLKIFQKLPVYIIQPIQPIKK